MPLIGAEPNRGDLIEFLGPVYSHWGVYVGDHFVVHLTAGDGHSSVSSGLGSAGLSSGIGNRAVVKKQTVGVVAKGRIYKVNNKYDNERKPRPPEQIVKEAEEQVGKQQWYHLTADNCEHFATEMRYGQKFCDQVACASNSLAVGIASAGVVGSFSVLAGIGVFIATVGAAYTAYRFSG